MNPQEVATTMWALCQLPIQPGSAQASLLVHVPKLTSDLTASQLDRVRCGMKLLLKEGVCDIGLKAALHSLDVSLRIR
jgi:hypothetical protein